MRRQLTRLAGIGLALWCAAGAGMADWRFEPAVDPAAGQAVFPHLEAAGRQSIAAAAGQAALAWEDARDGTPRCRVALRPSAQAAFTEFRLGGEECYTPAIAALGTDRFGVIWEDEAGIGFATVSAAGPGPALRLAPRGNHPTLAWHPRLGLGVAWSAPEGRPGRIWRTLLSTVPDGWTAAPAEPADPAPPADDQLYPVLAAGGGALHLAWEDRRHGHTVVYASRSVDGRHWTAPVRVSGNPSGKAPGTDLGRGTGAMRPALAPFAGHRIAVAWLDKRDFLSGYDVYAVLGDQDGARFGRNLKAQDSFGDAMAQWHAAAAGNARGDLVIAWDDERDGNADIWLTWLKPDGGFADNVSPAPASGPASQSDPAIALDEAGNLHLAWIERSADGTAGLRYSLGRRVER